jgi:uncharacterized protein (TIGR02145 family)
MRKATIALLLICTAVFAQQKGTGTFTDSRDGKKYKTVKIGEQVWMAQNLDYQGKDGKLGVCYDNKPENCKKYGRLYDWATVMNIDAKFNEKKWDSTSAVKHHQGICPSGWHVPTKAERGTLANFASTGGKGLTGKKLKAKSGWNKKNDGKSGNGTDNYNFSALPGGYGNSDGSFQSVGSEGYWWSADGESGGATSTLFLVANSDDWFGEVASKSILRSVRCLQDGFTAEEIKAKVDSVKARADSIARADSLKAEAVAEVAAEKAVGKQFNPKIKYGSMTDERDKTTYKTIKIGEQTWMAENLNYDAEGSKCYGDRAVYCKRDGRLYGWETAKKVCPAGWHLPSKSEYEALDKAAGGKDIAGKKLKAKSGWNNFEGKSGNGTDDFGFSALPGGSYSSTDVRFGGIGSNGSWWSVSGDNSGNGWSRGLGRLDRVDELYEVRLSSPYFSVRCVQD